MGLDSETQFHVCSADGESSSRSHIRFQRSTFSETANPTKSTTTSGSLRRGKSPPPFCPPPPPKSDPTTTPRAFETPSPSRRAQLCRPPTDAATKTRSLHVSAALHPNSTRSTRQNRLPASPPSKPASAPSPEPVARASAERASSGWRTKHPAAPPSKISPRRAPVRAQATKVPYQFARRRHGDKSFPPHHDV